MKVALNIYKDKAWNSKGNVETAYFELDIDAYMFVRCFCVRVWVRACVYVRVYVCVCVCVRLSGSVYVHPDVACNVIIDSVCETSC